MRGEAILSMIWLALGGIINGIETTVWKIKNTAPTYGANGDNEEGKAFAYINSNGKDECYAHPVDSTTC